MPNQPWRSAAVALVVALGLLGTACSKDAIPSASSSPSVATVQQIASIVARYTAELRKATAAIESCRIMRGCQRVAYTGYMSLPGAVAALEKGLVYAADPSQPTFYVGGYPSEVANLVRETETGLHAASVDARQISDHGCWGVLSSALQALCEDLHTQAQATMRTLDSALNAWESYL